MFDFIITITFVFVIGYSVYIGTKRLSERMNQKTRKQFVLIADKWQLELLESEEKFPYSKWKAPYLEGKIKDCFTRIFMYEQHSGDETNVFTKIEIEIPSKKQVMRFKLYPKNVAYRIFYGKSNVTFSNPEFEKNIIVQSIHKEAVQQLFDEELMELFIQRREDIYMGWMELKNDKLVYELSLQIIQANQRIALERVLDLMVKLVERL